MSKACNSPDWELYLEILKGYGLRPKLRRLIQPLWGEQVVLPKAGRCYGRLFKTGRGVNQGDPVSPTVFKIMVDKVVRAVLLELLVPQEAHHRLG